MFEYRPLGRRVVIRLIPLEKSIVLPDGKAAENSDEAVVVNVGGGVNELKVGDVILLSPYNAAGTPIYKRGKDMYMILTVDQIIAVKDDAATVGANGRAN